MLRLAMFWFALFVKPRHEKSVAAALKFKGYEEFVPLYRSKRSWSDRVKDLQLPLFPGYIFCRFDLRSRGDIVSTPGVAAIVGFGKKPEAVSERELQNLRRIDQSEVPAEPWPYLSVGQPVLIHHGPLRGLQGILLETGGTDRLVVSVTLLQRSVAVRLDTRWLKPCALPVDHHRTSEFDRHSRSDG